MSGRNLAAIPDSERLPAVDAAKPWDPSWQPPWLLSRMNEVSTWDRRPQLTPALALTDGMRASIGGRIDAMERALAPASLREVAAVVADLLAFYSTSREDEISLKAKLGVWVETLAGVPIWALREAVRRWHAGRLSPNTSFCPSPAVILKASDLIVGSCKGQIVTLERLLAARVVEPVSEEEKARVGEKMRRWADEMRALADTMNGRASSPPLAPGGGDEQAVSDGDAGLGAGSGEHGAGDTATAG